MADVLDVAFAKAMRGRSYGPEETRDARDWFTYGWAAAIDSLANAGPKYVITTPTIVHRAPFGGSPSEWVPFEDYQRVVEALNGYRAAEQLKKEHGCGWAEAGKTNCEFWKQRFLTRWAKRKKSALKV